MFIHASLMELPLFRYMLIHTYIIEWQGNFKMNIKEKLGIDFLKFIDMKCLLRVEIISKFSFHYKKEILLYCEERHLTCVYQSR